MAGTAMIVAQHICCRVIFKLALVAFLIAAVRRAASMDPAPSANSAACAAACKRAFSRGYWRQLVSGVVMPADQ